MYTCIDDSVCT